MTLSKNINNFLILYYYNHSEYGHLVYYMKNPFHEKKILNYELLKAIGLN